MLQLKLLLLLPFILSFGATNAFLNFSAWFQYDINGTTAKPNLDELGLSRGQCAYNFYDYVIAQRDRCMPDDRYIVHLQQPRTSAPRKPPIMVKCLQSETWLNTTSATNSLLMMESVKDMVTLLKPIGNATKRHEPGSCVVVFFYTDTCITCIEFVPKLMMLPHQFPTLRIAAIDALRFPNFNTEFGIVGLPTLLLFHQGRPIVKYYRDIKKYSTFVRRHTGIQPTTLSRNVAMYLTDVPLKFVHRTDYVLFLAWSFVLLCLGYYFARSRLCQQIVEMVKRNWRESEAQMEHN